MSPIKDGEISANKYDNCISVLIRHIKTWSFFAAANNRKIFYRTRFHYPQFGNITRARNKKLFTPEAQLGNGKFI